MLLLNLAKFTTCQKVRLCALLYQSFFGKSIQFLFAFKNMYLCYNIVACMAMGKGYGGCAHTSPSVPIPTHN